MRKETQESSDAGEGAAEQVLQEALELGVLSDSVCKAVRTIEPAKLIAQADGLDIVKKATNRKGRCLMLLGCQVSLVPGAQLGELEAMDTQTPVLHINCPGGAFKLEGTFVYPRNRYTVLKLGSRQSVQLEYAFEHIIVFSNIQWIGTKEENPSGQALPIPDSLKELPQGNDRGPVSFGQGLGTDSARGGATGGPTTPSKPRNQPARKSRGKPARVVDSDESGGSEEEGASESGDAASDGGSEDGLHVSNAHKRQAVAKQDKAVVTTPQRKAGGKVTGARGPAESKRKRESLEATAPVKASPANKRRASARSAGKPNYTEVSDEEGSQRADDGPESANDSDYSSSR